MNRCAGYQITYVFEQQTDTATQLTRMLPNSSISLGFFDSSIMELVRPSGYLSQM